MTIHASLLQVLPRNKVHKKIDTYRIIRGDSRQHDFRGKKRSPA